MLYIHKVRLLSCKWLAYMPLVSTYILEMPDSKTTSSFWRCCQRWRACVRSEGRGGGCLQPGHMAQNVNFCLPLLSHLQCHIFTRLSLVSPQQSSKCFEAVKSVVLYGAPGHWKNWVFFHKLVTEPLVKKIELQPSNLLKYVFWFIARARQRSVLTSPNLN